MSFHRTFLSHSLKNARAVRLQFFHPIAQNHNIILSSTFKLSPSLVLLASRSHGPHRDASPLISVAKGLHGCHDIRETMLYTQRLHECIRYRTDDAEEGPKRQHVSRDLSHRDVDEALSWSKLS